MQRARSLTASAKRCQCNSVPSMSCILLIVHRIWTMTSAEYGNRMSSIYMSDNYTIVAANSAASSSKAPGLAILCVWIYRWR